MKWTALLLVLVLGLSLGLMLGACGDKETPTTTAGSTETTQATETETTEAPEVEEPETEGVEDTGQIWSLKFSYGVPSQASLHSAYLMPWAKAVTEATDGRVTIEAYPDSTLAKDDQQYDALLSGTSDISVIEPEYTTGVFPVFEVASLPRLFADPAVASAVMWDVAQEYCQDEFKDIQVVAIATISGAQYFGNKEVKVPADFQGLKMRSGGKVENWMLKELKAEPIDIMIGDVPSAMERGLAEGGVLSWSIILSSGAKDYTKYRTHLNLLYRPWFIAFNKDVWESMPTNIQEAIMSVSGLETSIVYSIANEEVTQGARKALEGADKGKGNPPIYEPTDEEMALWTAAMEPVWQQWVNEFAKSKSPFAGEGQAIIDFILERADKYANVYEEYMPQAGKVLESLPKPEGKPDGKPDGDGKPEGKP